MPVIEPIEILLDKPRKILVNHRALFRAEAEINKIRGAQPGDHAGIDILMVDAFNSLFRSRGMLPLDLLLVMIWASLSYAEKEPRLSIDQVADLLDAPEAEGRASLSGTIWAAYFKVAVKNLKAVEQDAAADEKKSEDPPTGSGSGAADESSFH